MTDEQIVQDLEAIAGTGINAISPYPPFLLKYGNPEPDFSKMDLILSTAERLRLSVMPALVWSGEEVDLAAANWPDRFPPHLDAAAREARLFFADPEVLALVDRYLETAVKHFRQHPCVVAYNVWDEPHMAGFSRNEDAGVENPHFNAWFKEWALKKYGSLAAWYAQWNDEPYFNQDYQVIDRALFYWDATARVLEHFNERVKSIDPVHPTRSHNTSCGSTAWRVSMGASAQDDWSLSKCVDQYGISYYTDCHTRGFEDRPELFRKQEALWDTPWSASLLLTAAHDAAGGKPFVLPEVITGPQTGFTRYADKPGDIFDYNRIHLLAWQLAAHDAKGLYFWKWRPFTEGQQAFGRGLVAVDGSLTGRAVAAGDAARVLNSDPDLFLDSKPLQAQVAVVYDVAGWLKGVAQGRDWGAFTSRDMIGIYSMLWSNQVRVNILDARQLTAAALRPYKLVIFPFYLCLRRNVAEAIKAYVAEGGTAIADARFGIINELGRGYPVSPGLGMATLFGARRHGLVATHNPLEVRVTDPAGLGNHVTLPSHLLGRVFREELRLEEGSEGKVVAVFEESNTPAVVARRTGKGQSVLLGFSLGIPLLENHDPGTADLLRAVLQAAGVEPPVHVVTPPGTGPVEAVVHSRGHERESLVYLLNWGQYPINSMRVELPSPGRGRLQAKDMVSGTPVSIEQQGDRISFHLNLPRYHAAVVHIQP